MVEPTDVNVSLWEWRNDPNPVPVPDTNLYYKGIPKFLERYKDLIEKDVRDTYVILLRVKGARPINIKMTEKNIHGTGHPTILFDKTLTGRQQGYKVSIPLEQYAGQHTFLFTALNTISGEEGRGSLRQTLTVTPRKNYGG